MTTIEQQGGAVKQLKFHLRVYRVLTIMIVTSLKESVIGFQMLFFSESSIFEMRENLRDQHFFHG